MLLRLLKQKFGSIQTVPHNRHQTGKLGEKLAEAYLKQHTHYKLLDRNWSNGRQEIDLIFTDGKVLVFVEVRARSIAAKVPGYATLTRKKRMNLRKAAYSYMNALKKRPHTYRYDAVELRMQGSKAEQIHHFKNIQVF